MKNIALILIINLINIYLNNLQDYINKPISIGGGLLGMLAGLTQPEGLFLMSKSVRDNLDYANPNGNAVFRVYDKLDNTEFIEVGMGPKPDNKFWVAVQTPDEGYIVVHRDLDRGWYPEAKSIVSFTDRAGLTVNNGARIVVTNLDIGKFEIESYSVHGMEGSTDPPAINSGVMIVEILSGDPGKNMFAFFPFYVAAGIGIIGATLYFTKKRS